MARLLKATNSRRVSVATQRRTKRLARGLAGSVVVVRSLIGSFTGCLLSVGPNGVRLRIFSGIDRTFVTIEIPFDLILDVFGVPCSQNCR